MRQNGLRLQILHGDNMVKQKIPNSSLCVWWVFLYTITRFILKERIFHELSFHVWWTMLAVHNKIDQKFRETPNRVYTNHAVKATKFFYIVMKTFCGILLYCLDASPIIKRYGIRLHDFWQIVKYAHFPSTAIWNQLPGRIVSTQMRT